MDRLSIARVMLAYLMGIEQNEEAANSVKLNEILNQILLAASQRRCRSYERGEISKDWAELLRNRRIRRIDTASEEVLQ